MTMRRLKQEILYLLDGKKGGRETERGVAAAFIALAGLDAR